MLIVDRLVVAVALTSSKGTTIKRKKYDQGPVPVLEEP
jgi:hypothetical protein